MARCTAITLGPLRAAIYGFLVAVVFAVGVQLAFNSGTIVAFLYPLASLLLGVIGALAIAIVLGAFERERVRDVFSRFVPEPVVADVLKNVDEDLRLGGEKRGRDRAVQRHPRLHDLLREPSARRS